MVRTTKARKGIGEKEQPLSDDKGSRESSEPNVSPQRNALRDPGPPPREHPYLIARVTNRAAAITGMRTVGMASAALSTLGLSLLRRRGLGQA